MWGDLLGSHRSPGSITCSLLCLQWQEPLNHPSTTLLAWLGMWRLYIWTYIGLCLYSFFSECGGGAGREAQGCLVWVCDPESSAVALPSTVAPTECLYLACVSLDLDLNSDGFHPFCLLLILPWDIAELVASVSALTAWKSHPVEWFWY